MTWLRAEFPGEVVASAEALTGSSTLSGHRVQDHPAGQRGRPRRDRYPRSGHGRQGGCLRLPVRMGGQVEQAHPPRLDGPL